MRASHTPQSQIEGCGLRGSCACLGVGQAKANFYRLKIYKFHT